MYNYNKRRNKKKIERSLMNLCIYCGKVPPIDDRKGCSSCLSQRNAYSKTDNNIENRKRYNLNLKYDVINKYGGVCTCCGESEVMFLTIDHINNDGYKDADKKRSFYYILRREPIREDLQILCFNCNCAKAINGGICPHKKNNKKLEPFIDKRIGNTHTKDKNTKINWPDNDILVDMCNSLSVGTTSKKLGVCYSTLLKRLKNRNLFQLITKKYKKKSDTFNK